MPRLPICHFSPIAGFSISWRPCRFPIFPFSPILPFYETSRLCNSHHAYRPPMPVMTFCLFRPCRLLLFAILPILTFSRSYRFYHFYHSGQCSALTVLSFLPSVSPPTGCTILMTVPLSPILPYWRLCFLIIFTIRISLRRCPF